MPPDRRTIGPGHHPGTFGDQLQLCTSPARIVPLCPRASFRVCPGTKNAARAFSYTGVVLVPAAAFGAVRLRVGCASDDVDTPQTDRRRPHRTAATVRLGWTIMPWSTRPRSGAS